MGNTALREAYRLTAQFGGHGVATRLPGWLGLFISILGHSTLPSETIATDGKLLRVSYEAISDNPTVDSHPAIILVTAYIVDRGLILEPYEMESKMNEITALPALIKQMALQGESF